MTNVPISETQVLAEMQKIVASELDFEGELEPGDDLIADLDLDSLAMVTLAGALEDRFKIILLGDESLRPRTVGDLCQLVVAQVRDRS